MVYYMYLKCPRVTKPSSIVKVGDKVTVKIIDLDKESEKLLHKGSSRGSMEQCRVKIPC